MLDGHALMLQLSHNTKKSGDSDSRASAVKKVDKKESSTKIIVRNVAFEATRKDLQQLFNPFGQVNIQLLTCSAMLHLEHISDIILNLSLAWIQPSYWTSINRIAWLFNCRSKVSDFQRNSMGTTEVLHLWSSSHGRKLKMHLKLFKVLICMDAIW